MTDYRAHLKATKGPSKGFKRNIERKLCVWLNDQYGCQIDPNDRKTLVAALSDGVILCKLIRDLSGNRRIKFKSRRPNIFQKNENIRTFSQQCKKMGISAIATLAPSDLRDGATKKVMACLMHLYRQSKDWKAKGGTKEKPGVVKMVLIKPKRAKVEIVTDYLSNIKLIRRKRMQGTVASIITQPLLQKSDLSAVTDSDTAPIIVDHDEIVNEADSSPSKSIKKEALEAEKTGDADEPVDKSSNNVITLKQKTMDVTKDEKTNEEVSEDTNKDNSIIVDNETTKLDAAVTTKQDAKQSVEAENLAAGNLSTVAFSGENPEINVLLVQIQEMKLENDRLRRHGLRCAAQITELKTENMNLQAIADSERRQRLDLKHEFEKISVDKVSSQSLSSQGLQKESTHKIENCEQESVRQLSTVQSSPDMDTPKSASTADEQYRGNPQQLNGDKNENVDTNENEKSDDDDDDEESVDYGLDDEDEIEEEEEVNELEINQAAEIQLNAAMKKTETELIALRQECANLREKYAEAQNVSKHKGDQASAKESKIQMAKYMQLLGQLQQREAEFDELQLDREELHRMRREAEARLSTATQRIEKAQEQLQYAASTEKELQDRCHTAEEALRCATTELDSLRKKMDDIKAEVKDLRKKSKTKKRELQKAAAAAANAEIRAVTDLFEKKLRGKEAKAKEAKRKARAAAKQVIELKKVNEAQIEALKIKLHAATKTSPSGLDVNALLDKPKVDTLTPLAILSEKEHLNNARRAEEAYAEKTALEKELAETKMQATISKQAITAEHRKTYNAIRLELQAAESKLKISKAELQLLKSVDTQKERPQTEENEGTTSKKEELTELYQKILEMKHSAGRAEQTFLHALFAADEKYAALQDKFVLLQQQKQLEDSRHASDVVESDVKMKLLQRRIDAFTEELRLIQRKEEDNSLTRNATKAIEVANESLRFQEAKMQIKSLKEELDILLGNDKNSDDQNDFSDSEKASENPDVVVERQKCKAAQKAASRTRKELETVSARALMLGEQVNKLQAEVTKAEHRVVRALDDVAAETTRNADREAKLIAQEAAAIAHVEKLQDQINEMSRQSTEQLGSSRKELALSRATIKHLQQQQCDEHQEQTKDQDATDAHYDDMTDGLRQADGKDDVKDDNNPNEMVNNDKQPTEPINRAIMQKKSDSLIIGRLRAELLVYARQQVELEQQRDEIKVLIAKDASKEEVLALLRADVANLRDDRDTALDEMLATQTTFQQNISEAEQKALKSATLARKKIASIKLKASSIEKKLIAEREHSASLQKRLNLFHTPSVDVDEQHAKSGNDSEKSSSEYIQLTRDRTSLLAEVKVLADEVSSLRTKSLSAESRATLTMASAELAEQKAETALKLLQQARNLASAQATESDIREAKLRTELTQANEKIASVHESFEERLINVKTTLHEAQVAQAAANEEQHCLKARLAAQMSIGAETIAKVKENIQFNDKGIHPGEDDQIDALAKAAAQFQCDNKILTEKNNQLHSDLTSARNLAIEEARLFKTKQVKIIAENAKAMERMVSENRQLMTEVHAAEAAENSAKEESEDFQFRITSAQAAVNRIKSTSDTAAASLKAELLAAQADAKLLHERLDASTQRFDAVESVVQACKERTSDKPTLKDTGDDDDFKIAAVDAAKTAAAAYEQELMELVNELRSERSEKLKVVKALIEVNAAAKLTNEELVDVKTLLAESQNQYTKLQNMIAEGVAHDVPLVGSNQNPCTESMLSNEVTINQINQKEINNNDDSDPLKSALIKVQHFQKLAAKRQQDLLKITIRTNADETALRHAMNKVRAEKNAIEARLTADLATARVDLVSQRSNFENYPKSPKVDSPPQDDYHSDTNVFLVETLKKSALTVAQQSAEITTLNQKHSRLMNEVTKLRSQADSKPNKLAPESILAIDTRAIAVTTQEEAENSMRDLSARRLSIAEAQIVSLKAELKILLSECNNENPIDISNNESNHPLQLNHGSESNSGVESTQRESEKLSVQAAFAAVKRTREELEAALKAATVEHELHAAAMQVQANKAQANSNAAVAAEAEVQRLKLRVIDLQHEHAVQVAELCARIKKADIRNVELERQSSNSESQIEEYNGKAENVNMTHLPPPPPPASLVNTDTKDTTSMQKMPKIIDDEIPLPVLDPVNFNFALPDVQTDTTDCILPKANIESANRVSIAELELNLIDLERQNALLRASEKAARKKLDVVMAYNENVKVKEGRNRVNDSEGKAHHSEAAEPVSATHIEVPNEWIKRPLVDNSSNFVAELKTMLDKPKWSIFRKASSAFRKGSVKMPASKYAQVFIELFADCGVDPATLVSGLLWMVNDDGKRDDLRNEFLNLMHAGNKNPSTTHNNQKALPGTMIRDETSTSKTVTVDGQSQVVSTSTAEQSLDKQDVTVLRKRVAELEAQIVSLQSLHNPKTDDLAKTQTSITKTSQDLQLQKLEIQIQAQKDEFKIMQQKHRDEAAAMEEEVALAKQNAAEIQMALDDLSSQKAAVSTIHRVGVDQELQSLRRALEKQRARETELSEQLVQHKEKHIHLAAEKNACNEQFATEAAALRAQIKETRAEAQASAQDTALQLASDQVNALREEAETRDNANFEVQRQLNERLELLSGTEEQKVKKIQQLANTCQMLREQERDLRNALDEEIKRNEELRAALQDQELQEKLKAADIPAPKPLTAEEKAALAEARRLEPLSNAIHSFLRMVQGSEFDQDNFQRLPPWNGFDVETEGEEVNKINQGDIDELTDNEVERDQESLLIIRSISLTGMRLRGTLPLGWFSSHDGNDRVEMGHESARQMLRVSTFALGNNRLNGCLSRKLLLGMAPSDLRFLELNDNSLVGRLPSELGIFTNLLELKLQYNKFTGIIPTEIGQLQQLQRLQLGRNALSGAVPSELGKLGMLRVAEFHNNRLSSVPAEHFTGLKRLTELKLQGNQLRDSRSLRDDLKKVLGAMCYVVL